MMMFLRRLPAGSRSVMRPACSSQFFSVLTMPNVPSSREKNDFQLIMSRKYQSTGPLSSSTDDSSLSYSERQAKKGRPVSPHVQVYAFPITAISSITNRVTGVALSVGVTGIGAIALMGGDAPLLMSSMGNSVVGPLAKMMVSFPLVYHYLGGVRHYLWDNDPEMLKNDAVTQSSYYLFGASGAITLILGIV